MHDYITGKSATGIIHMINKTPIEWYSKRQATVETSTYGSEFVAARIATEQIIDLRYTLRMFGVLLDGPAWMFGDNLSVVVNSTIPQSTLKKRHNALAYHRVREAIAAGILNFVHINGKENPADILTKFRSSREWFPLLKPILYWQEKETKETKSCPLKKKSNESLQYEGSSEFRLVVEQADPPDLKTVESNESNFDPKSPKRNPNLRNPHTRPMKGSKWPRGRYPSRSPNRKGWNASNKYYKGAKGHIEDEPNHGDWKLVTRRRNANHISKSNNNYAGLEKLVSLNCARETKRSIKTKENNKTRPINEAKDAMRSSYWQHM